MDDKQLTEHFKLSEFACPCCEAVLEPEAQRLAEALEITRGLASEMRGRDCPIRISSGYRCAEHNTAVGGSPTSQHLLGLAADLIFPPDVSMLDAVLAVYKTPQFAAGGIGVYPYKRFVHVDLRGTVARWGEWRGNRVSWSQIVFKITGEGKSPFSE